MENIKGKIDELTSTSNKQTKKKKMKEGMKLTLHKNDNEVKLNNRKLCSIHCEH